MQLEGHIAQQGGGDVGASARPRSEAAQHLDDGGDEPQEGPGHLQPDTEMSAAQQAAWQPHCRFHLTIDHEAVPQDLETVLGTRQGTRAMPSLIETRLPVIRSNSLAEAQIRHASLPGRQAWHIASSRPHAGHGCAP